MAGTILFLFDYNLIREVRAANYIGYTAFSTC